MVIRVGAGVLSVLLAAVAIALLRPRRAARGVSLAGDDGPWPPERHHTPAPGDRVATESAPAAAGGAAAADDAARAVRRPVGDPPGSSPAVAPDPPAARSGSTATNSSASPARNATKAGAVHSRPAPSPAPPPAGPSAAGSTPPGTPRGSVAGLADASKPRPATSTASPAPVPPRRRRTRPTPRPAPPTPTPRPAPPAATPRPGPARPTPRSGPRPGPAPPAPRSAPGPAPLAPGRRRTCRARRCPPRTRRRTSPPTWRPTSVRPGCGWSAWRPGGACRRTPGWARGRRPRRPCCRWCWGVADRGGCTWTWPGCPTCSRWSGRRRCGRAAATLAGRLSAAGVGVAVVGEALGAEPPDGYRRLAGLPEPPRPGRTCRRRQWCSPRARPRPGRAASPPPPADGACRWCWGRSRPAAGRFSSRWPPGRSGRSERRAPPRAAGRPPRRAPPPTPRPAPGGRGPPGPGRRSGW